MKLTTTNPQQTMLLGKLIGECCVPGDVLLLNGELGTGKTLFTKGIALALEIPTQRVISPSFTIIFEYHHGRIPLYHMDFYRLNRVADLEDLGLERYGSGDGVLVVEWADRIPQAFPVPSLRCEFAWQGENERVLSLLPQTERWEKLLVDRSVQIEKILVDCRNSIV